MNSLIKTAGDKVAKERRTNLLVLVRDFLVSEGYVESVLSFESEARLSKEWSLCDNVDLNTIVEDFESYFFVRFKKYPKISRKNPNFKLENSEFKIKDKRKFVLKQKSETPSSEVKEEDSSGLSIFPVSLRSNGLPKLDFHEGGKLWRGLGTFEGYSEEWKALADVIAKEVIDGDLNVRWSDVVGLEDVKQTLKEAIVYPMLYPELFKGIVSPWKGLLLYGPSGTGKTLLARAAASECSTTFFNISASSLVSKWRGDSEKLVRVMFELARHQAPSIIFIDEIDALVSKRDSPSEHEASRRLKSEFLVQLDGLVDSPNVFLLTTSNLPWDLDPAVLRRIEKKVYVDLPNEEARASLFSKNLPHSINKYLAAKVDPVELSQKSAGYSGADIKLVCKEALMVATRSVIPLLHGGSSRKDIKCKVISTEDVVDVLEHVKPVRFDSEKFKDWREYPKCEQ